ncbi:hypothetical protein NEAUS03_2269 [Nematocida ausubeli]|nr:hypothetical protein NEAUS03_2269 [Nematocida ausubeli]
MVYPNAPAHGKRTSHVGYISELSPEIRLTTTRTQITLTLTQPFPLKLHKFIRIFGSSRNNSFLTDSFMEISQQEATNFHPFRKLVRTFYRSELNLNLNKKINGIPNGHAETRNLLG